MSAPADILVLRHHRADAPGFLEAILAAQGLTVREVRIDEGASVPSSLEGARAVVSMGGPMSAYDADPFLVPEKTLLAESARAGVPVLGICLGAQILASALGGKVAPNARKEIGWYATELTEEAKEDAVFGALPSPFTPFHWHGDAFDVPPGAVSLARSAITPVQAFRFGEASYGIQFHLESSRQTIEWMLQDFADELARENLDAAALREESALRLEEQERLARVAFGAWATRVAAR